MVEGVCVGEGDWVSAVSISLQSFVSVSKSGSDGFAIGVHVRDDVWAWLRVLVGIFR